MTIRSYPPAIIITTAWPRQIFWIFCSGRLMGLTQQLMQVIGYLLSLSRLNPLSFRKSSAPRNPSSPHVHMHTRLMALHPSMQRQCWAACTDATR